MIIAAVLTALGLLIGAWVATTRGYRLGGVVVLPLLVVYTLINLASLPIFLLSAALAYVGVDQVQRWRLVYGRRLLLTSIVIGMTVPVAIFLSFDVLRGEELTITGLEFMGGILPGIAAYNFHREESERRVPDVVASAGVFLFLAVLGVLALVLWMTPPCVTCAYLPRSPAAYVSPVLLSSSSDIAGLLGYETFGSAATIGTVGTVTLVTVLGLGLSELSRTRLGLRSVGVITLPLIALFALRAWWVVPLYLAVGAITTAAVFQVHRRTLLYGRALLSVAGAIGIALALGAVVLFGLSDPFPVLFTGLFSGIGAYNLHVVAPRERFEALAVNGGIFVAVFGVARAVIDPLSGGLGSRLTAVHFLVGGVVLAVSLRVWRSSERTRPSTETVRDAAPLEQEHSR